MDSFWTASGRLARQPEHDGAPDLSREHILAHLRGEEPEEPEPPAVHHG